MQKTNKNSLVRSFIALELPREAIDYIEELQNIIKKKGLFSGKFTEPENLHLTLKFLGEISEEKVKKVQETLRNIKFPEFEASLADVGIFINRYNSILWIKLNGKGIWDLQQNIDKKLGALDFASEERFRSHITIARMKKIFSREEFLNYIKNIKAKKIHFKVKSFVLKKSELKPEGPIYSDVESFKAD